MAFDYTGWKSTIGKILGGFNEVNTYRTTTFGGRITTIVAEYPVGSEAFESIGGVFEARDAAKAAMDGWISYLSTLLLDTTIDYLNADRKILDESLEAVITELARRAVVDSQTFNDCPSTASVASVGSPTGDHQVVVCRHDFSGKVSDFIVPDVYLVKLTADRSQGGTEDAETFSIVGKPADSLPTDAAYPTGTGINTTVTAVDPATDGGLVTDGGFDEWTTADVNVPEEWTIVSGNGVAGTTVFRVANDAREGATSGYALRLLGNGTTLHKIRQEISPEALGTYNVHFRVYDVADPGTDWAVTLSLVDSTGTAIAGPASYSNVVTSGASTALASSWANPVTGQFVLPAVLPEAGVFLEIRFHQSGALTTAAANTAECYVDHVSVQEVEPLYDGGIGITIFSDITEGVVGDTRTVTTALSAGAIADFVLRGMDRLLGLAALPVRLPTDTAAGETIADSIIA